MPYQPFWEMAIISIVKYVAFSSLEIEDGRYDKIENVPALLEVNNFKLSPGISDVETSYDSIWKQIYQTTVLKNPSSKCLFKNDCGNMLSYQFPKESSPIQR